MRAWIDTVYTSLANHAGDQLALINDDTSRRLATKLQNPIVAESCPIKFQAHAHQSYLALNQSLAESLDTLDTSKFGSVHIDMMGNIDWPTIEECAAKLRNRMESNSVISLTLTSDDLGPVEERLAKIFAFAQQGWTPVYQVNYQNWHTYIGHFQFHICKSVVETTYTLHPDPIEWAVVPGSHKKYYLCKFLGFPNTSPRWYGEDELTWKPA